MSSGSIEPVDHVRHRVRWRSWMWVPTAAAYAGLSAWLSWLAARDIDANSCGPYGNTALRSIAMLNAVVYGVLAFNIVRPGALARVHPPRAVRGTVRAILWVGFILAVVLPLLPTVLDSCAD